MASLLRPCGSIEKQSYLFQMKSLSGVPLGIVSLRSKRQNATARLNVLAISDLKEELRKFAAAEKRWKSQIDEGKVKAVTPKEAGYAFQLAETVLLDVRPSWQRDRSWVKGSLWVPAFEVDGSLSPGVMLDKFVTFATGGWWSGAQVTKRNERFMADIAAAVPRGANVIVACQSGLTSLAACEHLYRAGYRNLSWLDGGFDTVDEEDFPREGSVPLDQAGIGGISELIGWTEPQRKQAAREGSSYQMMRFGKLLLLFLAVDAFIYGAIQLRRYLGDTM